MKRISRKSDYEMRPEVKSKNTGMYTLKQKFQRTTNTISKLANNKPN